MLDKMAETSYFPCVPDGTHLIRYENDHRIAVSDLRILRRGGSGSGQLAASLREFASSM